MTPGQSRFTLALLALASSGVAANIMLLQKSSPQRSATIQQQSGEKSATAAVRGRNPATDRTAEKPSPSPRPTPPPSERVAKAEAPRSAEASRQPGPAAASQAPAAPVASDHASAAETISAIQRELQSRGYEPGAADGVPGLVTRAAIMAFEHDNAMPLTGEPSDPMLKAIVLGASRELIAAHQAAIPRERRQIGESVIRTVQQSLTGIGYNSGKASGRMSDDTERAIREFETDQGLAVTGRISAPLVARLAKAAGNGRLALSPQ